MAAEEIAADNPVEGADVLVFLTVFDTLGFLIDFFTGCAALLTLVALVTLAALVAADILSAGFFAGLDGTEVDCGLNVSGVLIAALVAS